MGLSNDVINNRDASVRVVRGRLFAPATLPVASLTLFQGVREALLIEFAMRQQPGLHLVDYANLCLVPFALHSPDVMKPTLDSCGIVQLRVVLGTCAGRLTVPHQTQDLAYIARRLVGALHRGARSEVDEEESFGRQTEHEDSDEQVDGLSSNEDAKPQHGRVATLDLEPQCSFPSRILA